MSEEYVNATLKKETDAAILITQNKKDYWIPRSIIRYIQKQPPNNVRFTLPTWKVNELKIETE